MTDITVTRNDAAKRFEIVADGVTAELRYDEHPRYITLIHTEVPPALEGRGYGGALARTALEYAREKHLRVVPRCPFVRSYLERHPEYAELTRA
jgi:predicted GNAT family acetyltransferase